MQSLFLSIIFHWLNSTSLSPYDPSTTLSAPYIFCNSYTRVSPKNKMSRTTDYQWTCSSCKTDVKKWLIVSMKLLLAKQISHHMAQFVLVDCICCMSGQRPNYNTLLLILILIQATSRAFENDRTLFDSTAYFCFCVKSSNEILWSLKLKL